MSRHKFAQPEGGTEAHPAADRPACEVTACLLRRLHELLVRLALYLAWLR